MPRPSDGDGKRRPHLKPARVFGTRDLAARGANAPRLAQRLMMDRILLGSVRTRVVRDATCTVLTYTGRAARLRSRAMRKNNAR